MEDLKVVTISPLTKNAFNDGLTYFTSKDVKLGSLVQVPIRKANVLAVITSIKSADEIKTDLKSSEFGLKKVERVISENALLSGFVTTACEAAEYFVTSPGQIIKYLTPTAIIDHWRKEPPSLELQTTKLPPKIDRFEISVLGLPDQERYSFYRSLIREEFAKKRSVFFILPSIHDTEKCGELLQKGIEDYTIVLHGRLGTKVIISRWEKALQEVHPVLVITTPSFLSLPRSDIATIIIDKENSSYYKSRARPYIDVKLFAEKFSKNIGAKLILGDSIPNIEDIYNAEAGTFVPESPIKYRFPKDIHQGVVDMRKMPEEDSILCPLTKKILKSAQQEKEQSIVICTRKGLGTSTACSDCGEMILCSECNLPMILFRTKQENIFTCNRCGTKTSTDIKCARCGGWRLKALGVATEKIEDEIKKLTPHATILRLDGNIATNYKQARLVIDEFEHTSGAILIGTEMILNYINSEVPNIIIASIDTLFAIPDFRISENIFNFLTRVRFLAGKNYLIQTRKPQEKIFEHVTRGDLLEFYRNEIKNRKKFDYPPFKTLIKITAEGPRQLINKEMTQLEIFLKNYDPKRFNAFIERINNKDRVNILLKVNNEEWPPKSKPSPYPTEQNPYSSLLEILQSLPKRFAIRVEPENIL